MNKSIFGTLALAALLAGCGSEETMSLGGGGHAAELPRLEPAAPAPGLLARRASTSGFVMRSLRDLPARSLIQPASFAEAIPAKTPCMLTGEPSALLQTASSQPVAVPMATGWRYRLGEVSAVYLAALVRNVCGTRIASFDVYAPDGSLFTRLAAPYAAGAELRQVDGGYVVEVVLPLDGASAGIWSVNFSLDGDAQAIGVGLFELYP